MEEKRKEAWTRVEHVCFLKGLDVFGQNWDRVHFFVRRTRTLAQVQAHGASFMQRQKKNGEQKRRSIHR